MLSNPRKQNILEKVAVKKPPGEAFQALLKKRAKGQFRRLGKKKRKLDAKNAILDEKARNLKKRLDADPTNKRLLKKKGKLKKKYHKNVQKHNDRAYKAIYRLREKQIKMDPI